MSGMGVGVPAWSVGKGRAWFTQSQVATLALPPLALWPGEVPLFPACLFCQMGEVIVLAQRCLLSIYSALDFVPGTGDTAGKPKPLYS